MTEKNGVQSQEFSTESKLQQSEPTSKELRKKEYIVFAAIFGVLAAYSLFWRQNYPSSIYCFVLCIGFSAYILSANTYHTQLKQISNVIWYAALVVLLGSVGYNLYDLIFN